MAEEKLTQEQRILRMVKKVLTDVARDTYTPTHMKHPLSEQTIHGIRDCLALISAREAELADEPSKARPRFIDEPQTTFTVNIDNLNKKKDSDKPH